MNKTVLILISLLGSFFGTSQNLKWSSFLDTSTTFSSARAVDLNNDNTLDIVIGGGLDGQPESNGVNAINGLDGSLLWNFHTDEEMFGSAQFMDITGDNVDDIFIGGRYAEFYAINGSTGDMIWEFFPYSPTVSLDSGWFNFYNPQFIPDQNSDGVADILVANGGNHSAPPWDTLREPGMLMVLDAMTGSVLAKDTMPDGKETYCSPIVMDYLGQTYIIYGSGGENDRGALWRVKLVDLMSNDISNSQMLASDPTLGFIAPSSLADMDSDGVVDIINQAYDGTIRCFNGVNGALMWEVENPGTESSSGPTIGNFTGDNTPDVFNVVYAGAAPSFYEFYQVLIDGATGQVAWLDSLGAMHYGSSSAVDLNGDGRDEVISSINYHNGVSFSHQLVSIDFQNDVVSPFYLEEPGVNLASTVLIEDLDGNGYLDFTFAYRADSLNPMGQNGFYVKCLEDQHPIPGVGVAWGGYMGTNYDGYYNYQGMNCGTIATGANFQNISCNHFADATITVNPSGGITPYTYLWSTGEVTDSIGGLDVGSYTVTITDSVGCFVEASFNAVDPYVITFGAINSPTCPGDSTGTATVNSSGCPCMFSTCVFDWESGDSTKTATSLWEGWQYITITHMDGCIVDDSVFVPNAYPVLDSLMSNDILCATNPYASSNIQLYLHNEPLTDITWSTGDTLAYIDSLDAGIYYFDLLDNRGCEFTDSVLIESPDTLQVQLSPVDLMCFEDSTGQVTSTVTGGYPYFEYSWSTGDTTMTLNNLDTGWYHLSIIDSVGCGSISDSVFVDQPDPLMANIVTFWNDSIGICDGGAVVEVSGGTIAYTYNWDDQTSTANDTVVGLCEGTYYVTITDANGCEAMDSVQIINTVSIKENGLS
ncbi:MAG: hypothetical protein ACO2Z9_09810, partial [Crocinitomicaceae bacterium]